LKSSLDDMQGGSFPKRDNPVQQGWDDTGKGQLAMTGQSLRIVGFGSAYCVLLALALLGCSPAPTPAIPTASLAASTATPLPSPTLKPPVTPTLTATPDATPTPLPRVCSPLAVQPLKDISAIITQPFIMPRVMPDGSYKDDAHHGVDLGYYTRDGKLFTGTPVQAALMGKIAAVIHNRPPYGNMLMVETAFERIPASLITTQNIPAGNSLYTLYAHLQNLKELEIGQGIDCGQQIAETGLTGFTGGPHLHFETRWGPAGSTFPSMAYYKADATPEELANYEKWRMSGFFRLFDPMELLLP
jgi:murein DD-endopeptidase MepM/ murein hydrolase activator NlpD